MTLSFPNPTRSFDEKRNAVQFVGHDGVFEVRFFVEASALADDESGDATIFVANCLSAFDTMRDSIEKFARKAYSNKRLNSYTLSAANFR